MNRKEFLKLTITLIGGATVASACSSSGDTKAGTGGSNGSGGGNASGGSSGSGAGGSSVDAKADTTPASMCSDPLPSSQVADSTGDMHMLSVFVTTLSKTTDQILLTTGFPQGSGGHFHTVTLTVADLGTLSGGGSVTKTSSVSGDPAHSHMFMISCKGD